MGCCDENPRVQEVSIPIEDQLEVQKRNLLMNVQENDLKIADYEKEIQKFDKQIKQGETDIKLNQYQLKENELKAKAKKLLDIKKDRERAQRNLDSLKNINETLKNNLENFERKIDEQRNMATLDQGRLVMEQYKKLNNQAILENNITSLLNQRIVDERTNKILQRGNKAYIGNDPNLQDEDAYLKQILGNGTTS